MIANIQQGDCIKCIDCGKEFNVNIEFDWDFEYITGAQSPSSTK